MCVCPPPDMLGQSWEPSRMRPKNQEYWSRTVYSPVTEGNKETHNAADFILCAFRCVYVSICLRTDKWLSLSSSEESGKDRKEGPERSEWPMWTSISTEWQTSEADKDVSTVTWVTHIQCKHKAKYYLHIKKTIITWSDFQFKIWKIKFNFIFYHVENCWKHK